MSVTASPRAPGKAGVPLTDLSAGLFALVGILAALHHRQQTAAGQHIEPRSSTPAVALSSGKRRSIFGRYTSDGTRSAHRMNAPYQAVRCADGYITLGAGTIGCFGGSARSSAIRVARATEFADNARRVRTANGSRSTSRRSPSANLAPLARAARANDHPVRTDQRLRQVFRRSASLAREMVIDTEHPRSPHQVARIADQDERHAADVTRRAPLSRAHGGNPSRAGYSDGEIEALRGRTRSDDARLKGSRSKTKVSLSKSGGRASQASRVRIRTRALLQQSEVVLWRATICKPTGNP